MADIFKNILNELKVTIKILFYIIFVVLGSLAFMIFMKY